MVSHGLYWTLWMLSCLGQYSGEDLQFPEVANGAVGGSVVFSPNNPPSTSIDTVQWHFGTALILTALSDSTIIVPAYRDRISFDINTLALELWNLRLDDSGIYRLTVITVTSDQFTGETSIQVFENITNVRLTGPEEPLIEGESSANITSDGTGSIISVQWMKDNRPLSPSNSIIFSSDNRSVSISPVQRSDTGEYQCTYTNPVSSETAKLSLIINLGGGGGGLTSGAIAGIVIGVLVAVAGICGLIVYLTITKIPKLNLRQKRPASGAAQQGQESVYEEINDFQRTNGEGSVSGNMSESSLYVNLYENVRHGVSNRPRAPTPPQVMK
ncbi:cell adhesion molecule CEACAM1-like isoform X3 [Garra rufa]|uniref:cell adhesion molecule CEACAM1-like isoform X3 n=1 Tax=Garra rufa TaxID=137080 RepID=UPI003CCE761F